MVDPRNELGVGTETKFSSSQPAQYPPVSIFMTVLNEGNDLAATLESIFNQEYEGPIELAVACGPSIDNTRQLLDQFASIYPQLTVIDNPTGVTPIGLNLAIKATSHDILARTDGHAVLPKGYIRQAVETLRRTGAVNVGGIMDAVGSTSVEQAIAAAMTSRLGVGGAAFHVGGPEGPADSVYLGCFQRSALADIGGYDEEFVRAQDWELNMRLREAGGTIWFTPAMRVTYRPRDSFEGLARQYRDYGRWRRHIIRLNPATLSLRYLAAPLAMIAVMTGLLVVSVGGVAALLGVAASWTLVGLVPLLGYLTVVGIGGLTEGRGLPMRARIRVPRAIATMHFAWGWGFLTSRRNSRG